MKQWKKYIAKNIEIDVERKTHGADIANARKKKSKWKKQTTTTTIAAKHRQYCQFYDCKLSHPLLLFC